MTVQAGADGSQLSDEERAAIAKSFNDKSEPKKVISEGIKINGVKYMTIEASEDGFKAKKVLFRPLFLTLVGCEY
jgi:profilin